MLSPLLELDGVGNQKKLGCRHTISFLRGGALSSGVIIDESEGLRLQREVHFRSPNYLKTMPKGKKPNVYCQSPYISGFLLQLQSPQTQD